MLPASTVSRLLPYLKAGQLLVSPARASTLDVQLDDALVRRRGIRGR